jgi:hypothetical protein
LEGLTVNTAIYSGSLKGRSYLAYLDIDGNNVKVNVEEIECEYVDWIKLTRDGLH